MVRQATGRSARAVGTAVPAAALAGLIAFSSTDPAKADSDVLPPPNEDLHFTVYRDGERIGFHSVTFRRDGQELHVEVDIDFEITFAFVTLYRYSHHNHEIWRDGRLVSLKSRTDDNGDSYRVSARATAEGLRVEGSAGDFVAPAGVLPTSYWHPDTVDQSRLLDSQHGRLLDITVKPAGYERIERGDGTVRAKRYEIDGDLDLTIWYGPERDWTKLAFTVKGSDIVYRRRTAEQLRQLTGGRAPGDG